MSELPKVPVKWFWKCTECDWKGPMPETGHEFYNGPGFVESWLGDKPICPKCSADAEYAWKAATDEDLIRLDQLDYVIAPLEDCEDDYLNKLLYDYHVVSGLTPTLYNLVVRYKQYRDNWRVKNDL